MSVAGSQYIRLYWRWWKHLRVCIRKRLTPRALICIVACPTSPDSIPPDARKHSETAHPSERPLLRSHWSRSLHRVSAQVWVRRACADIAPGANPAVARAGKCLVTASLCRFSGFPYQAFTPRISRAPKISCRSKPLFLVIQQKEGRAGGGRGAFCAPQAQHASSVRRRHAKSTVSSNEGSKGQPREPWDDFSLFFLRISCCTKKGLGMSRLSF